MVAATLRVGACQERNKYTFNLRHIKSLVSVLRSYNWSKVRRASSKDSLCERL